MTMIQKNASSALLSLVVLLGGMAARSSAAEKHPFGRDDYSALHQARAVSVSPDAKAVLYEVIYGGAKGPEKHEWWMIQASGEGPHKLDLPEKFRPTGFTADGALFGGYEVEMAQQLAVVTLNGQPARIITLSSGIRSSAISPDGTRFALLADPRSKDPLEGEGVHRVVQNDRNSLYVMNVNGGEGGWWCPELQDIGEIQWSPDGSQIAVSTVTPKIGHHDLQSSIYVCNAKGGRRVAEIPNSVSGIAWARGGQELFFSSTITPVLTPDHLWSVRLAGGPPVDRTPQLQGSAVNVVSDAHGSVWVELHKGVVTEIDAWRNGRLETAYRWPEGTVVGLPVFPAFASSPEAAALSVSDPGHSQNVAMAKDGELKKITHEGDGTLAGVQLGEVRAVHWVSKDGVKLEGIVTFPANYDSARKWPFLVLPHGGPESNDELGFSMTSRIIAGMGYVVLEPEYRGSTGYGSEFLAAIYQHFGDRAYQDVDSATDFAIAQGWADPNRLAIFGWSAGGFMTSWTVTQTHRYRAAIEGAGITDWLSFIPTSDVWQTDYDARLQEQDPTPMLQFSAVMHADQVTTPLLILHGEADIRVPMLQGLEYFALLAERGKTVRMVTYPGSPHFPRNIEQRLDLFKEIEEWLRKYNP
ncbi:MAG TPA: S9 family peptidase [Candidatus Saccharimonadales bacterium]|jgi:dipeptidyl aminopeptidase/acylaminoacyl peptidase|nr:S9 family peptidase [Candidatus Saccharimonadales bacterium]